MFWACGLQQQLPAQQGWLLSGSFSSLLLFVICVVLWFILQLSDVRVQTVRVTINNLGQQMLLNSVYVYVCLGDVLCGQLT